VTDLHVGRHDLDHHGDAELAPGLLDLAVNVRAGTPPDWLRDRLRAAVDDVAAYPTTPEHVPPSPAGTAARRTRS
jgi:histidinol-phosphate/aromatic aminotransferase/cobyric acid decarboxylase-like protein